MTPHDDAFHKRGHSLEESFFKDREQKLLDQLRRRTSAEEARQVLASAMAVQDEVVIRELADASAPQFLAVLGIFPMVAVAWCDGNVSANERAAMLKAAHEMGLEPDSASYKLLERWLEEPPAANAFDLWSQYARSICATLKPQTVEKLRAGVMGRARKVAQATGGILGFGSAISAAEQACLDRLDKAFATE